MAVPSSGRGGDAEHRRARILRGRLLRLPRCTCDDEPWPPLTHPPTRLPASAAAQWSSATSTRCCTRGTASPRPRCSTTTRASPASSSPIWPAARW